MSPSLMCNGGK